jgi:hypothetical protein
MIAKLDKLANDPAAKATAEAESARRHAESLRSKPPPVSKYAPNARPLPETVEEMMAARQAVRERNSARAKKAAETRKACAAEAPPATKKTTPPPKPSSALKAEMQGWTYARLRAEVARLMGEVARLEAEVARLAHAEPARRSNAGRKPIGDRAMTAAERMRKMRSLRNVTQ